MSTSKIEISIFLADIEGAFFDTDKSSVSGHVDIDVLTESDLQYRRFFDIVLR
jgi:hypothetical protein